ncbi:zinc-binding dehydrogenase [Amycolatopsis sp. GM8]|uniref:quinone oxidoreductase family protein n=1 Tax=Amycolatopsis sp. GM8 TaxID=2896530 RepID=UPI001F42F8BB|nr:zinc-binding dehydrogenase [Amycolatopsis sp. GM8]
MRAVVVESFGGPEVLGVVEVPDPAPGQGQVLIEVEAAGVNRADVLTRAGEYHRAGRPPVVLGLEAAGTVTALGEGASGFRVGQKVVAMGAAGAPGFYAEQAAVSAERVVALPDGLDPAQAAALPVAWHSAWYCLHNLGRVQPGETVLIHAAASGVGSAAVQIAVAAGARVIAAAGTPVKTEWVAALGAHEVLDSRALTGDELLARVADLTDGRGAEVVLDTVGGDVFALSLKAAAHGGRVMALANVALAPSTIDTRDFYPKNVSIHGYQSTNLIEHGYDPRGDLGQLIAKVAHGELRVPVDSVFPLEDAAGAHRRLESRATRGKVVLTTGAPA